MGKMTIKELVDKETYLKEGENAWDHIHYTLIETLNQLNDVFGYTMIVNTWSFKNPNKYGGIFTQRGWRSPTSTTGAKNGAHPKGMAADIDFYDQNNMMIPANAMRRKILANIDKFPHIRCLEININWVHVDTMGEEFSSRRKGATKDVIMLVDPQNNIKFIKRGENI